MPALALTSVDRPDEPPEIARPVTSKRVPDAWLRVFRWVDRVGERLPGVRRMSGIVMASGTNDGRR